MRGLYLDGRSLTYRDALRQPEAGPDEVLLRVRLVGICDTDLHLARGYMGFRGIPGHEFVGETETGDRYTAEINCSCHACPTCRAGMPNHCPNRTVLGILGHDGSMAEWVAVPQANLHPIPDSLADEIAVFAEPLAAAYRVPEQINLAGERVAVLGDGKLGLLCAWVARAVGARTTLVGKHPEKLRLAGDGIKAVELGSADSLARSFDIVIEATGNPTGLETALRLVRPAGTVVLKTTMTEPHTLALAPVVIDEVRLIGSRCGPFRPALRALDSGAVDVRPLIQAEYPLEDGIEAFRVAASPGARKVLLRP